MSEEPGSAFGFGLSGGNRGPAAQKPDGGRLRVVFFVVGALVVAFGLYALLGLLSGDDGKGPRSAEGTQPTSTSPAPVREEGTKVAEPRELEAGTAEDQLGEGHVALKVTRAQILRTRPAADGQVVARVGRKTPYGGQVVLPIIKARGDWVGVVSPYRKNNRVAWTKVAPEAKFVAVEYSVAIRVRSRSIIVRRNGEVIRRMKAAVGQVTHPTPPGRYAVTDGLIFTKATRGTYGCCALVLSARQTKLPPTWTGGDRIAIHGTPNKASIGLAASLGCLRVGDANSRWLVENVPVGTTVFVKT